jgi:hypothetical protein
MKFTQKVLGVTVLVACTGCVHSPYGMSLDRHNYTSTPHMPLTLTLVDTMSGETVWELDVPIYKKAVLDSTTMTTGPPRRPRRFAPTRFAGASLSLMRGSACSPRSSGSAAIRSC